MIKIALWGHMKAKIMKVPDVGQVVTSTFHINI